MTDARHLTRQMGGKWYGGFGSAPCPVCQPQRRKGQNALSISPGRDVPLSLKCFRLNCPPLDILAAAGIVSEHYKKVDPLAIARRETEERAALAKREKQARANWDEALPIAGTVAEKYMREARGITCALPDTLRFHPEAWHGPTARRLPALVALVQGGDGFAVHRTYLRPDGLGKAGIEPQKMMLGAVAGGAVRLIEGPSTLAVAEGIETALSLACGLLNGPATIWAALSTSGMQSLRLPGFPGRLLVAADGDNAGQGAAMALADRASREGWVVSILTPPQGCDFNDMLRGEVAK